MRLHPKWYGLGIAAAFFLLALWTLTVEATLIPDQPGQALFYSGLRTLFAFLGGAGFTAFLSMHIYQYVTSQNQVRGWEHEFDVDKVREVYGPLYDELKRAEQLLDEQFAMPRLRQVELLRRRYMSLLVPETLLDKGEKILVAANQYRDLHDRAGGKLNNVAENTTRQYLQGNISLSVGGGEWQYVFGATHPSFEKKYNLLLELVDEQLKRGGSGRGSVSEFEVRMKAALLPIEEGRQLRVMRDELKESISEILAELEPLIREPYKE